MKNLKQLHRETKLMKDRCERRLIKTEWESAHIAGDETLNFRSELAQLSYAYAVMAFDHIEEDEYMTASPYKVSMEYLVVHNPLVHYLLDQIFKVQKTNKLIVEGFYEYLQFMLDHVEVYTHEEKGVKKPTKILYMGRQITETDFKAIMEHVARVHLESMKSFRTGMWAK